jgi:membrane-bound lytic murein transglycosylase F
MALKCLRYISFVLVLIGLTNCQRPEKITESPDPVISKPMNPVLKRIFREGRIVATTDYNSTNYFIYRGEPMGYQYELLKSFASYLNVKLEVQIINDLNQSFNCINTLDCDLIALGLTVTKERSEIVDFTEPLAQTRQMLIQKKPDNWRSYPTWDAIEERLLRNPLDLANKTIHIQKNSSYRQRLENLSEEIGADITIIEHTDATVEELITMVADGEIEYTVCDEHIALVNQKYYPNIDVRTAISFPQNIAWAVRKGSTGLLDTINAWLRDYKKTRTYAFLYNKYFKNTRTVNIAKSEYFSLTGGKISPYDNLIRKYSALIDWDWRLLASLIYQESRFYPDARSWAGAYGLMQLMPHTAEKFGVDSLSPPEEQIKAGVKFIKMLDQQLSPKIENKEERTKFVLASYNAGIAHVYDARRLAEKYERDPNKWDENVDYFLLNKSKPEFYNDSVVKYGYCRGAEPYHFVYDILDRFQHYKNVIVE